VEVYDPALDSWSDLSGISTARYGACAAVVDGKIYVIGGYDASDTTLATVEMYDPATDTWTNRASMSTARGEAFCGVYSNKIYVMGGWDSGYFDVNEEYDPATDTWTAKAPLPDPRGSGASDAPLVGDALYLVGGVPSDSDYYWVIFRYAPAEDTWTAPPEYQVWEMVYPAALAYGPDIFVFGGGEWTTAWPDNIKLTPGTTYYLHRKD
jgi:N-acetylneuraminic acid mutarotase